MTTIHWAFKLFLLSAVPAVCVFAQNAVAPVRVEPGYIPVHTYDPARDAALDIQQATSEARKTNKNILLEVGGNWCPWCHKLDEFFQNHPDVLDFREAHFIVVDVYYGSEHKNEQVLSRYSKLLGIPHFFVLDENGNLLHSQHAAELQTGGDYDSGKMKQFLSKWSQARPGTAPMQNLPGR